MIQIASNVLLFVLMMTAVYHGIMLVPVRANRWRTSQVMSVLREKKLPDWLFKCLGLKTKIIEEKRQLLLGCGIRVNADLYEGGRRILLGAAFLIGTLGYAGLQHPVLTLFIEPIYVLTGAACMLLFLF